MKHDDNGLAQMQSLPLDAKVRMTVARIRSWADYWEDDIYIYPFLAVKTPPS